MVLLNRDGISKFYLCVTARKQIQQQVCKPSLMKLEVNKYKKFALIPIRLKSNVR